MGQMIGVNDDQLLGIFKRLVCQRELGFEVSVEHQTLRCQASTRYQKLNKEVLDEH